MCPPVAPLEYAASWEDEDGFGRIGGNYTREYVEDELWPWLKQRGFADDGDDTVLRTFSRRISPYARADASGPSIPPRLESRRSGRAGICAR